MCCAIWYHLYNLKNVKNTRGEVSTLLKLTFLHGYFSRFLTCANGTKTRNAPQMSLDLRSRGIIDLIDALIKGIVEAMVRGRANSFTNERFNKCISRRFTNSMSFYKFIK